MYTPCLAQIHADSRQAAAAAQQAVDMLASGNVRTRATAAADGGRDSGPVYMRHRFALECFAVGLFPQIQSQWGSPSGGSNQEEAPLGEQDLDGDAGEITGGWSSQLLYSNQVHVWADVHPDGEGCEHVLVVHRRQGGVGHWNDIVGVADVTGAVCVDVIAWFVGHRSVQLHCIVLRLLQCRALCCCMTRCRAAGLPAQVSWRAATVESRRPLAAVLCCRQKHPVAAARLARGVAHPASPHASPYGVVE